jgi:DNA replication protein DnaC
MNEKIEETLRRLAAGTSKASSPTTSNTEHGETPGSRPSGSLGDPDCPACHGLGYLRRDLPIDHTDFGRLEVCTCRQAEVRAMIRSRLFSLSRLDELQSMTFDNFQPHGQPGLGDEQRSSIERAYEQARSYAGSLQGWLFLQGGYGCGKTHLAAAIANECVGLGVPTLFLTVPDLLDTLRFSFSDEDVSFEERFEQIRQAPLLILDDFGTQSATEWAREKLFQILNHRYINRLATVVTTNLALEEIEGRMRSRLLDSSLVDHVVIHAPDHRRPKDDTSQHELSSLALHTQQTLGNFNLRRTEKLSPADQKSLERAFEAARVFAEAPRGWLVLNGPYGSGKTHLAAAIANYRASQGHPVMFVVVPDLLDHLRATFNPSSSVRYDRRFEEVRAAGLLVLDDLGTQATTPWVREKLYQLFNHRYNAGLPTVITTADPLDDIDPRLRTRMLDSRLCTIHAITAPAFRGGRPRRRGGGAGPN